MKKMSLLIFAILILGCGTETPVVEKPIVEEPEPVIEELSLIAASGQHLRVDIVEPTIAWGTVSDGEVDVDPHPLHAGIRFDFDENLKLYKIDLRLDGGQSLGWLPRGVVDDEDIGDRIEMIPAADSQMLEFDTAYIITFYVQDLSCWSSDFQIRFRTKPKP